MIGLRGVVQLSQARKPRSERGKKLKARLRERPFDARALMDYADLLYDEEDFMSARKVYQRAIRAISNDGEIIGTKQDSQESNGLLIAAWYKAKIKYCFYL